MSRRNYASHITEWINGFPALVNWNISSNTSVEMLLVAITKRSQKVKKTLLMATLVMPPWQNIV